MQGVMLDGAEQGAFARAALALKYDVDATGAAPVQETRSCALGETLTVEAISGRRFTARKKT